MIIAPLMCFRASQVIDPFFGGIVITYFHIQGWERGEGRARREGRVERREGGEGRRESESSELNSESIGYDKYRFVVSYSNVFWCFLFGFCFAEGGGEGRAHLCVCVCVCECVTEREKEREREREVA